MRQKTIMEPVFVPEDLMEFIGWEIRKVNTSEHKTGMILQNPDSGEKRKLLFSPNMFDGECMHVITEKR